MEDSMEEFHDLKSEDEFCFQNPTLVTDALNKKQETIFFGFHRGTHEDDNLKNEVRTGSTDFKKKTYQ